MSVTEAKGMAIPTFSRSALGGRIVFGAGALARLRDELELLAMRRVMLIVAARDEGLAKAATDVLGDVVVLHWDEVRQHVPSELARRAGQAAAAAGVDALVTVGGGSTTGLGKAIAVSAGHPLAAVPTTYAGSEMTPIYGLTEAGDKRTAKDARALPALVVYDPELLRTLPAAVVGPSGMNALAHCVEALWAPAADPVTDVIALEGARLLVAHLEPAYRDGDVGSRAEVLLAASLAGNALGTVGTSLHHALCHLLGGMFDLPHAETHAIVLPHAVAYVLPVVPGARRRLAAAFGVGVTDVADTIWELGTAVGTPDGLKEIGLSHDQLPAAARAAVDKRLNSPRPLNEPAAKRLLEDAWAGRRPRETV